MPIGEDNPENQTVPIFGLVLLDSDRILFLIGQTMLIELEELKIEEIQKSPLLFPRPASGMTNEKSYLNSYYGVSTVIRDYVDLDYREPIFCQWPHGINLSCNCIYDYDLDALPVTISYSEGMTESVTPITSKKYSPITILPAALPYKFVDIMMQPDEVEVLPNSCLVFLEHSSLELSVLTSGSLSDNIKELREVYSRVNACIFWIDLLDGKYSDSYQLFDQVYCAGTQFSQRFLYAINLLMRSHEAISSRVVGTHVWYAGISNRPFLYEFLDLDYRQEAVSKKNKKTMQTPNIFQMSAASSLSLDHKNIETYLADYYTTDTYCSRNYIKEVLTFSSDEWRRFRAKKKYFINHAAGILRRAAKKILYSAG